MRFSIFIILLFAFSPSYSQKITAGWSVVKMEQAEKEIRDYKFQLFYNKFKTTIANKDIQAIKKMTSRDFFDGGGGLTIEEWLKDIVFPDLKEFNDYLNDKVVDSRTGGDYLKVIGKMQAGTLFFKYNGLTWLFGGVIGD